MVWCRGGAWPCSVDIDYTYDTSDRLTAIDAADTGGTIEHWAYTYTAGANDTGLRQTMTTPEGDTVTYSYDPTDQLTAATTRNSSNTIIDDRSWVYDAHGNRTSQTVNAATTSYAYNDADQLCWTYTGTSSNNCATPPSGAVTHTYDDNGNLTATSSGDSYTYNGADQTTAITTSSGTISAADYHDVDQDAPFETVAAGTTTEYLTTLVGLTAERRGTDITVYLRTPTGNPVGIHQNNTIGWYLTDALGSITAIVNNAGQVTNQYRYTPFGTVTETNPAGTPFDNPIQYAQGHTDPTTNLIRFGTRYYQPDLGRWTQSDPAGTPNGPNTYLYVNNNPTNLTDPTGLLSIDFSFGFALLTGGYSYNENDIGGGSAYVGASTDPGPSASATVYTGDVVSGDDCYGFTAIAVIGGALRYCEQSGVSGGFGVGWDIGLFSVG